MAEISNVRTRSPSSDNFVERKAPPRKRVAKNNYDSPEMLELHRKIMVWFDQESARQKTNRFQMALDEDYYDSLQWDEDDAQTLIDRGQAPVVYNEIKGTIDWMIGTELRMRLDFKVLSRRKDGTGDAEIKTSLLKYLSDVNKSVFHRSRSFDDAIKAGMGVIEVGIRNDPSEELLYERHQDWRSTLYDSNSTEHDMSDARYFFRWKEVDDDVALAWFPDRADIIRASTKNEGSTEVPDWYQAKHTDPADDWQPRTGRYQPYDGVPFAQSLRKTVVLYECWYRVPVTKKVFNDGDYAGEVYDKGNQDHQAALTDGCTLFDRTAMEIRVVIYTAVGIVYEGKSPYHHGKLPFIVIWCYRRKRDNAPYGCIRALRDPQDGMNKRHSKAHWILSSNQIKMEAGAVDDIEEIRDEAARADGVLVINGKKDFELLRNNQLADQHLQLMDRDAQFIRSISGVQNENLGRQTNATSGIAIQSRQEMGSVVNTEPFNNYRYALQQLGEIELSNCEQFYSQAKVIRITGGTGSAKYMEINAVDENGKIINDVTAEQADFVIDEIDYKSTLRQAMFESLFDFLTKMASMGPEGMQAAMNMLDLVTDMADLPNKDELVKRIREINGQRDPDAEMTPEEMQQQQQNTQQQAEAQALQQRAAEANIGLLEAKVANLEKQSAKLDADKLVATMTAIVEGLQAAGIVATTPGVAPVADAILKTAGFPLIPGGIDPNIPPVNAPQVVQSPAQGIPMPRQLLQGDGAARGIETVRNDGITHT